MQVVIDEVLVRSYRRPLIVVHIHFLAGTVVHSSKDVDVVIEITPFVEESRIGHGCQLDELKSLHVQDHRILGSSRVVMSSKDHYFVRRYQCCSLCLYR